MRISSGVMELTVLGTGGRLAGGRPVAQIAMDKTVATARTRMEKTLGSLTEIMVAALSQRHKFGGFIVFQPAGWIRI
jgi:hypothetical protein